MAQQTINIGSSANDGTGDPLRTAFDKINDNFDELYGSSAEANDLLEDTSPQLGGNLDINGFNIVSSRSNEDIVITPNGTGGIVASALRIAGTTLSSDDSSLITVAEGLQINGATNIDGVVTATSTVAVTGATTLSSTLAVTGTSTFSDGVTAESLITNSIQSNGSNADISIQPSGTGDVVLSSLRVNGTTLDSSDSTKITIAETVDITGATAIGSTLAVTGAATLSSTLGVTGAATLSSTLAVTGTSTFSDGVTAESLTTNVITANGSNASLSIQPSGTGDVQISSLLINGTTLDSSDSTIININEALNVDGTINVEGAATMVSTLGVTGATTLSSTLSVSGASTFLDGVTAESLTSNILSANGSNAILFINGSGTGGVHVESLQFNDNTISSSSNADIELIPGGTGNIIAGALTINGTTLSASDSSLVTIAEAVDVTGALTVAGTTTLTGSFRPAIHTFTATDAITEAEHAGRTLLLGEVGGNAEVTLTLPAASGTGNVYKFIVSVTNTSNYIIKVANASDTIDGIMLYLDEDGTAVTAFPTVAASDTITLNGGTTGGIIGDYLEIIDIATNQFHVRGVQRVAAGANPATPFSATVS